MILIVIIILLLVFLIYLRFQRTNFVYVRSDIDNDMYLVRDLPDKQRACNMLAKVKSNILLLTNYMQSKMEKFDHEYQTYINKLSNRIKYTTISENSVDSSYTSYTVNKGDKMVFCVRSKYDNTIHDLNLIMYVALHEISHIACPETGHTTLFKKIFGKFTEEAININIYKKIDFDHEPTEYCGLTITDSII